MLLFWIYITIQNNTPITYSDAVYSLRNLPPLSTKGQWGIFESVDDDSVDVSMYVKYTKTLLYSPNNHQGVNELIESLSTLYPQVEVRGFKNSNDVQLEYEANLFSTWAVLEFQLTEDQISTNQLITSSTTLSAVNYELRICPFVMVISSLLSSLVDLIKFLLHFNHSNFLLIDNA